MSDKQQVNAFDQHWAEKFHALCYEVFYKNKTGKELLSHLELKHFRSPVANPSVDANWAFFNEGKNEMLRSFTLAISAHINSMSKNKEG